MLNVLIAVEETRIQIDRLVTGKGPMGSEISFHSKARNGWGRSWGPGERVNIGKKAKRKEG